MQPYQRASASILAKEEDPIQAIKGLGKVASGSLGAGLAYKTGAKLAGVIAPKIGAFLSDYIPEETAIRGLSKIDPRLKTFVDGVMQEGYSFDDVRNFLGEKVRRESEQEKEKTQAKDNKNIIERVSPKLHQFIDQEIRKGRSALEAGAIAQSGGNEFKKVIDQLVKEHKIPWSSLLESVYGASPQQAQSPDQMQNAQPSQQGQQPQQSGTGQQALMQILQKIQQSRGAR